MDDLNQTAQRLPANSRKLFLIAAWYSWIIPFVLLGALILNFFYGPFYGSADDGTKFTDWDADGDFYFIVECILFSCLVSGIVSLFGIWKHTEPQIRPIAIIGIVLSLGIGFLAKAVQLLSHMVVG